MLQGLRRFHHARIKWSGFRHTSRGGRMAAWKVSRNGLHGSGNLREPRANQDPETMSSFQDSDSYILPGA